MTIGFWNLQQLQRGASLGNLFNSYEIDLMVLAEYPQEVEKLRAEAAKIVEGGIRLVIDPMGLEGSKTIILAAGDVVRESGSYRSALGRLQARRIATRNGVEFILASVHLPSNVNWSSDSIQMEAMELARQLRSWERDEDLYSSVVIGDFNLNPFDSGLVGTGGFHASMSESVAKRGPRTVQGQAFRTFYNPMWSLLGDRSPGPAGTHYYSSAEHFAYLWNVYDQVLFSPEFLEFHVVEEVSILEHNGMHPLRDRNGKPGGEHGSDHFPIIARINLGGVI